MAPVKKKKLSEAVIEEIRRMMKEGRLKVGGKLPDHSEFAKQLGVSRTTLREAVHTLSLLGVIEQRSGYGTVLTGPVPPQYEKSLRLPFLEGPEVVAELLEARKVTELGTVELAARRATPADLEHLGAIVEEMRRSMEEGLIDRFVKKDLEFHHAMARASGNRFLVRIFEILRSFMEQFMVEGFRVAPGMVRNSLEQHERIHRALVKGDASMALREMRRHIAERRKGLGPLLRSLQGEAGKG